MTSGVSGVRLVGVTTLGSQSPVSLASLEGNSMIPDILHLLFQFEACGSSPCRNRANYSISVFLYSFSAVFPSTALCRVPSNCLLICVMLSAELSTPPHSCIHLCSIRYLRIFLIPLCCNVPLVTHIIYHCIELIEFVRKKRKKRKKKYASSGRSIISHVPFPITPM